MPEHLKQVPSQEEGKFKCSIMKAHHDLMLGFSLEPANWSEVLFNSIFYILRFSSLKKIKQIIYVQNESDIVSI